MSRGFGKNQKKIIEYLEEYRFSIPESIVKAIADHKPYTKSDRSKILGAIKRLKDEGVLVPYKKTRNLKIEFNNHYRKKVYPKPTPLSIDKNNKDYKKYKIRQSTLSDL